MITDEERREVARRIRHLCNDGAFSRLFSTCLNCDKWLEAVYGDGDFCADKLNRFSDCLEVKKALAARIADLIDRPTRRNIYDEFCGDCASDFKRWWDSPTSSEVTAKLLRNYCERW